MSNVYKVSEVVGSSTESMEDAVRNAVQVTAASVRNLDWFEVTEIRGHIESGSIKHWQVGVKIGFRVED